MEVRRLAFASNPSNHQPDEAANAEVQAMSAAIEQLVSEIQAAFESLNQRLVSRDQEVRQAVEVLVGHLEREDQLLAQFIRWRRT